MGTSSPTVTFGSLDGTCRAGAYTGLTWEVTLPVPGFLPHLSILAPICLRKALVEIPHLQSSLGSLQGLEKVAYRSLER